ncbi:beta strand repeat-containing protein, partial [Methylorubrum sp. POS3]|uniref:beta strand repeat-containing protein n=1 Tax=Methylorubrum sp. POS3 TaxID=2998492 RepID=UPI003726FED5
MANSAPTISGSVSAGIKEGAASSYLRTGSLNFADSDTGDTLTVGLASQTIVYRSSDGTDLTSSLTSAQTAAFLQAFSIPGGSLGRNSGSQTWSYALSEGNLDFLAAGQTVTVTSTVQVSDGNGGSATKDVVVTVTGTNDAPKIVAVAPGDSSISASVTEAPNTVASTAVTTRAGSIAFADVDLADTHTVQVAAKAGGYAGTLTAVVGTDTTGGKPGRVDWTYSVADKALDYLAAGQQATQVYTVTVQDGKGGVVKQDVTITLIGSNDAPTVSGGSSGAISEGTAGSYTKTGTLQYSDVDLADRLTSGITSQTIQWKTSTGIDLTSKITADQASAIYKAFSIPLGDLGTNKGSASWSFAINDSAIDFLGRLDVLTLTTNVQFSDSKGGTATKPITITIYGVNDTPTVEALSIGDAKVTANVVEATNVTGSASTSSARGSFSFTDLDVNDVHTISVKASATGYLGTFTPILSYDTTGGQPGTIDWSFSVADKALDYLAVGQQLTQVYAVTITDGKGGSVTQNVTVNLTGVDDAPILTGIAASAMIYEPLAAATGSTPINRGGTITVADPDQTDHLSISVGSYQIRYLDAQGKDLSAASYDSLTDTQRAAVDQASKLGQYLKISQSSSGATGVIGWNYAIDPAKLSFLGAGETVTVTSNVSVQDLDASGSPTGAAVLKPISVTLVGSEAATSVKSYLTSIVDKSYLSTVASGFTVGNQIPVGSLGSWSSLTAQDGVVFRAPIFIEVTQNGATFDGIDFRGKQVIVKADNVTFTNCYFDTSGLVGQSPLTIAAGASNTVVDHSTFDGLKRDYSVPNLISSSGINTTLSNNTFFNAPVDGIYIENGKVVGNYFSGGAYFAPGHSDAIWIGKTTGSVLIENNVIDWRNPDDARTYTNNAIRISGEMGNVDDVTIRDNVLIGGNHTITVTAGATWTHTADQVGTITNVRIYDNVIDLGTIGSIDPADRPADLYIGNNSALAGSGLRFGSEAVGSMPNLAAMSVVSGGAMPSTITATAASYVLGGIGSDVLNAASSGSNVIQGGLGRDFITGGPGTNTFLYKSTGDGADWIKVFNDATDKIDLSSLVELESKHLSASDWLWLDTASFTGRAFQINAVYNASLDRTVIGVDINGDIKADLQIQLSGRHTLTQSNFVLEHPDKPASILGSLWSGAGFDLGANTLTIPFKLADAPLVVRDGVVALQDTDGTLLPLDGMGTYKFLDQTVVQNDGSALVDDLWYVALQRGDLRNGLDAETHYEQTGWQAGYDPNPYFSTSGYLASHPDIAAAGINPLEHWSEVGWKLGFDPSASFDVKSYLLRYPAVAASGVDPLTDYLTVGKSAGRVAYGAIGDDVAATGFDAQYYVLAHPDVASSGVDPYTHYLTVGWQNGYNPNAFFNVSGYLAAYPDVAAAGTDPLQDYINGGWQAGRIPSADFDGALYLTMNPDVAAAGLNPLVHFLQIGANEGRVAFSVGTVSGDVAPAGTNDAVVVLSSAVSVDASSGVLANDTDANGDALSVLAVQHDGFGVGQAVQGQYGELTLAKDGSYTYQANNLSGPVGTPLYDTFNYVVTDGRGANSSAVLTLRVDRLGTASDDARDLALHIGEASSAGASAGVLANDSDPDGVLSVVDVNGAAVGSSIQGLYGTLTMSADGSYTYSRTAEILPADAKENFRYSVTDGSGQLNAAWLTIAVTEPPVVNLFTPTISGTTEGALIEGDTTVVTTGGKLSFSDGDMWDRLTTSLSVQLVSVASGSGVDRTAWLSADQVA